MCHMNTFPYLHVCMLAFLSGVTEVGFPLHIEELKYILEMSSRKSPPVHPESEGPPLCPSPGLDPPPLWQSDAKLRSSLFQHTRLYYWDRLARRPWSSAFHVSAFHLFPCLVHFYNVFPTDLPRRSLGFCSLRVYVACLTIYQALFTCGWICKYGIINNWVQR